MLVIRFNRTGRRNAVKYRVVVQEKIIAPGGRHVEVVGSWNPHKKEGVFKDDRIKHWISNGAQPSDSVHNLLVSQGVIEGEKRAIKMPKPEVKEEEVSSESTQGIESEEKISEEGTSESEAPEASKEEKSEESKKEAKSAEKKEDKGE